MKYAGYDLILIRGNTPKRVYLWINDDHVELRDAKHMWCKDTWETQRLIREELNDHSIRTLKIGPAGENLCYCSCIISDLSRAAGRGSTGAVWGSKNLKAIAARGTKGVKVAKPKEFVEYCNMLVQRFKQDPFYEIHSAWGTLGWVSTPALVAQYRGPDLPTLHHQNFAPFMKKNIACFGCSVHCSHWYEINEGKYKGTVGEGLEAVCTLYVGAMARMGSPAWQCKFNTLCNQLGVHNEHPGEAIAWACKLFEQGIITKEDCDGLEPRWGDEDVATELLFKMVKKEGFGKILDGYPVRGPKWLGRNSEIYASHNKGNPTYGDGELKLGSQWALGIGVSTRGRDHLVGSPWNLVQGMFKEMPDDVMQRLGKERYNDPHVFDKWGTNPKKARLVYDYEHNCALADMTGVCKFNAEYAFYDKGIHLDDFARLLTLATGVSYTVQDVVHAAEREMLLERAYNAREGIRKDDDYPPLFTWQLKHGKPNPVYNYDNYKITIAELTKLLDEYYRWRGCDTATGIPNRAKLEELGLKDVADDLDRRGILPRQRKRPSKAGPGGANEL
ncbi:MAG: aldehyde ferredoxin oxidoreductase C-terminal domain-containing protein, partial [Chloroflexota bacterium]|nr:aldehyde ferredoxin oxidoreductase C-terminal domain-containing protein [Chloroflexota bacterium]